jgi:hypothetical protein
LRAGGNRELEFGGRGFAHRTQVGDPYWSPCDYSSTYGTNGCGG